MSRAIPLLFLRLHNVHRHSTRPMCATQARTRPMCATQAQHTPDVRNTGTAHARCAQHRHAHARCALPIVTDMLSCRLLTAQFATRCQPPDPNDRPEPHNAPPSSVPHPRFLLDTRPPYFPGCFARRHYTLVALCTTCCVITKLRIFSALCISFFV